MKLPRRIFSARKKKTHTHKHSWKTINFCENWLHNANVFRPFLTNWRRAQNQMTIWLSLLLVLLLDVFLMRLLFSLLAKWRNWFHFSTTFMSLYRVRSAELTHRRKKRTKKNVGKVHANNGIVCVFFVFSFFFSSHWCRLDGSATKMMRRGEKRNPDECTEWPNIRHNTFALVLCVWHSIFFSPLLLLSCS